ncbi:MAG TPA: hypothetical protein VJ551_03940, partial [Nitrososphaeraceae archaeon]|nr:hypothetical protein [Nitrososphaeraceae archaeon]
LNTPSQKQASTRTSVYCIQTWLEQLLRARSKISRFSIAEVVGSNPTRSTSFCEGTTVLF